MIKNVIKMSEQKMSEQKNVRTKGFCSIIKFSSDLNKKYSYLRRLRSDLLNPKFGSQKSALF